MAAELVASDRALFDEQIDGGTVQRCERTILVDTSRMLGLAIDGLPEPETETETETETEIDGTGTGTTPSTGAETDATKGAASKGRSTEAEAEGCGCQSSPSLPTAWWLALLLMPLGARRSTR